MSGYEDVRARLDAIIAEYRKQTGVQGFDETRRSAALEAIRQLGFTAGDAGRWLDGRPRRGYLTP